MSSMDMTDILIIGGGPAGLQAALTAARVHRQAVILDDGRYRNASVAHMHNVIGADGNPPHQFRARVRDELTAYDTVSVRPVSATAVRSDPGGGFVADLADGTGLSAGTVILATGVSDELPEIPGLAEVWGGRAAHCPFCHAHEFAGGRIGIIGTARAG
ncbi:MAG: NAD(P)/FAD-dependent oxidoreductase, partial [Dietzia sp.]|nr:NAD(P)/FAD-dependent oxidoreductase [Dietzia sp.]